MIGLSTRGHWSLWLDDGLSEKVRNITMEGDCHERDTFDRWAYLIRSGMLGAAKPLSQDKCRPRDVSLTHSSLWCVHCFDLSYLTG